MGINYRGCKRKLGLIIFLLGLTACQNKAEVMNDSAYQESEAITESVTFSESEETNEPVALPDPAELLAQYQIAAAFSIIPAEDLALLDAGQLFIQSEVTDEVFKRMDGTSFPADCITAREDLRYLRLLHMGFDGETHIGEMVCNRTISDDLLAIFSRLYETAYPIEQIRLIDDFEADDDRSMEYNNTSCFNFRKVPGSKHLSRHASGLAIDINPLYNPYITMSGGKEQCSPSNGILYMDRSKDFPNKISHADLCYQLFLEYGFQWGGDWNSSKDYQHFDKR